MQYLKGRPEPNQFLELFFGVGSWPYAQILENLKFKFMLWDMCSFCNSSYNVLQEFLQLYSCSAALIKFQWCVFNNVELYRYLYCRICIASVMSTTVAFYTLQGKEGNHPP